MTSTRQRIALQRQIWQISNDIRGANTNDSLRNTVSDKNSRLAAVLKGVDA